MVQPANFLWLGLLRNEDGDERSITVIFQVRSFEPSSVVAVRGYSTPNSQLYCKQKQKRVLCTAKWTNIFLKLILFAIFTIRTVVIICLLFTIRLTIYRMRNKYTSIVHDHTLIHWYARIHRYTWISVDFLSTCVVCSLYSVVYTFYNNQHKRNFTNGWKKTTQIRIVFVTIRP